MSTPKRRPTASVRIRNVSVGSDFPVVVQSMTNTDTADPASTATQVAELFEAGSQLVRITVNNDEAAKAVPEIRQRLVDVGLDVPLIGGSVVVGIGWGIAGFCPGGAIPALGSGEPSPLIFVAAMIGGILGANAFRAVSARRQALA